MAAILYKNCHVPNLLFSDPNFQWGGKSSSVLRFFIQIEVSPIKINSSFLLRAVCICTDFWTFLGLTKITPE